MPDVQVPVIPISETTQFQEIPELIELLGEREPKLFAAGLFLFAVVAEPKWKTEELEFPKIFERAMIVCVNPDLGGTIITTLKMIEDRDSQRLGLPPERRALPPVPRSKLSVRKVFQWMESAPATVITFSLGERLGENLVGFIRTVATIDNFQSELRLMTKASDSVN